MGQAWCKEKSAKAQDSKSPLDRVFVRCAHKIYPGLKEDGSCLGPSNATHKVPSAPRKQLQRGQSIDSVDRPFHPSEWVDVNLEVACEPLDSALLDAANQRSSRYLARLNGVNSSTTTTVGAPVPPPRRRRRRRSKVQNNDSNDVSNYDASRSTESIDDIDLTRDSDDEFIALERSLEKSSSEVIHALPPTTTTRPKKNRSTSSLPQLPEEELLHDEEEEAKRPPRQMKTTSLPRDASLFAAPQKQQQSPQIPKRHLNVDQQRIDEAVGDNSIFKIDQAENVKTSTPVKAQHHDDTTRNDDDDHATLSSNLHDVFLSCSELSSKSHDSSSQQQQQQQQQGEEEVVEPSASSDMGYESKSSYLFAEQSNDDEDDDDDQQLSSGILGDALVEPSVELPDDEVIIVVVQRSLSDESLPSEMLIEEIEDDEDEEATKEKVKIEDGPTEEKVKIEDVLEKEKSQIPNELARQSSVEESFKTPPPTPEMKNQLIVENGVHEESLPARQLDEALNNYMDEKEKSPEVQIIPMTNDREEINNSSARLIDFHHRPDRRNPFDDLRNGEIDLNDSPPEKPSRLHQRSSLIEEESVIEASLIVPTPPRRRHRNHQRSSSNLDDHHQFNDRLI